MPLFFSRKIFDNTSSYKEIEINELPKLHRVALKGKLQKVRELVESTEENINRKDKFGRTALHYAAANGKAPVVEFLLRRHHHVVADPRDEESMTPLHKAVEGASIGCVTCLIDRRADVNAKDRIGTYLLHTAVSLGNLEICNQLIENNADVSVKNQRGQAPLHISAELGYCHIMSLLILHHANVNQQDNLGRTPLSAAACVGKVTSARLLIRHGAIVGIEDNEGNDAIMVAEHSKQKCVLDYLKSLPPDQAKAKDIPALPISNVSNTLKLKQFEEQQYSSIKLPEDSRCQHESNRKGITNTDHCKAETSLDTKCIDTKTEDISNEILATPATISSSICHETMQDLHKVFVKADKKVSFLEAENLRNLKRAEDSEAMLSVVKSTLEDELEKAKGNILDLKMTSKVKEENYKKITDETLEKCHQLELEITKYSSYIKLKESKMDADIDKRRQDEFERIASLKQEKQRLEQYLEVSQNKIKCLEDEICTVRELNDTLKFASRSREMLNNKIGDADTTMTNLRNDIKSLEAERKILIEENRKLRIQDDDISHCKDKIKFLETRLAKEKNNNCNEKMNPGPESPTISDNYDAEKTTTKDIQVDLNESKNTEGNSLASVSHSNSTTGTSNNTSAIKTSLQINNNHINDINKCTTCNQAKLIKKMQIDLENADDEIEKQDLQIENYQKQIINLKSSLLTMCSLSYDYAANDSDC